ncbi:MAG TPA: hypothetical protein VD994_08795 [Prosthecobacter sp.]|nr:hypothetical protein [Prosthecobacter sp.]
MSAILPSQECRRLEKPGLKPVYRAGVATGGDSIASAEGVAQAPGEEHGSETKAKQRCRRRRDAGDRRPPSQCSWVCAKASSGSVAKTTALESRAIRHGQREHQVERTAGQQRSRQTEHGGAPDTLEPESAALEAADDGSEEGRLGKVAIQTNADGRKRNDDEPRQYQAGPVLEEAQWQLTNRTGGRSHSAVGGDAADVIEGSGAQEGPLPRRSGHCP